jgi:ketosteroid isomerase-like protein
MSGLKAFDEAALRVFEDEWKVLFERGDAAAMAAFYAADAQLVATKVETVAGRDAIEQFWRATCDRARTVKMERSIEVHHVERSGPLGYARGVVVLVVNGARTVVRFVTLWRLEDDARWRCIVDISTP